MRFHVGKSFGALTAALALVGVTAGSAGAQDVPQASPAVGNLRLDTTFLSSTAIDAADLAGLSQAQAPPPSKPHHEGLGIGVKGGFLFSSLGDSPIDGGALSRSTGDSIGIFFGGNRPGRVGVEGELMYNIRKGKTLASDTLSIHSLEIPVLIRVNVGSRSLSGALGYIIVGPAVDLQLSASLLDQSIKSNYKGVNLDVLFGGGIEITRFFIEAREDIALRGVNSGNFADTSSIHVKTFALLFGFRFN